MKAAAGKAQVLKIGDLVADTTARLRAAGCATPGLDARLLVAHAAGISRERIVVEAGSPAQEAVQAGVDEFVARRLKGEPVHRILGYRDFFGRRFRFGEGALEPRPETEMLVERVLADIPDRNGALRFAEIGAGSGIISVSLLAELPNASAVATDIEAAAIGWTKLNAQAHGVAGRIELVQASCLEGTEGDFDFIVSNPPYIESADIPRLALEVREHDPLAALDGGPDGMAVIREILKSTRPRMRPMGRLYLETGHGQHGAVARLASENGWGIAGFHLDFSGLERIVVLS